MKRKQLFVTALAGLVISVGSFGGVYAYNKQAEAKEAAEVKENDSIAEKTAIAAVKKLDTSLTEANIENAKAKVKLVSSKSKKSLEKEIEQAEKMFNFKKELSEIISKDVIKKDVTSSKLKAAKKSLSEIEKYNKTFYKEQSDVLKKAEDQFGNINEAQKKIKTANETLKRSAYNEAAKLVSKIKNTDIKNDFEKELKKTDKKIREVKSSNRITTHSETSSVKKNDSSSDAPSTKTNTQNKSVQNNSTNSYSSSNSKRNSTKESSNYTPRQQYPSSGSTSKSYNGSSSKSYSGSTPKSSSGGSKSSSSYTTPKSSSGSASRSSGGSSPKSSSGATPKTPKSSSGGSGGTNWGEVGKQIQNKDWSKTGSGEIDKGGNTWDSWK